MKLGNDFVQLALQNGLDFKFNNKVTIVNVVPSVDTPVCEEQTHILGESPNIPDTVERVAISRDLPMAQSRFAKAAGVTNIHFYSDYKTGSFGKTSGLMIKGHELLARAVIVLNTEGKIVYMQIVDEVSALPNMGKAIRAAKQLIQ